jgi:hypothetical protein
MLKKSRRSAWILAASCALPIFLVLFLFQPPDLSGSAVLLSILLLGLLLFAVTTWTFYTVIARASERHYGAPGLIGWVLTGVLTALALAWIQRVYPSPFGLLGVAVIAFILFRWLSFWAVWKAAGLIKK